MDSGLRDCGVLITGASGGIGSVTARAFAAEDARVAVHYHHGRDTAAALVAELGERHCALGADLREPEAVDALFARAIAAFGRIDTVVVNAGIWVEEPAPLHEMTLEQWQKTIDADLTSAFLTCRAFLRHLADDPREHASIVLVASTAALFGEAGHADYSAAKAALTHGLTPSLKNEIVRLAPRGRVNCVCPGWVRTPMTEVALGDEAAVGRALATMALAKVATPEDIARAIVFLASDTLAGHVSGAVLPVAGGMEGRLLHPGQVR